MGSIKNLKNVPKKYLGLIFLLALFAVPFAYIYWSNLTDGKEQNKTQAKISAPRIEGLGTDGKSSQAYKEMVKEENLEKEEEARDEGKSYFPIPTETEKKPEPKIEVKEEPKKSLILPRENKIKENINKTARTVSKEQVDFYIDAMSKIQTNNISTVKVAVNTFSVPVKEEDNSNFSEISENNKKPKLDVYVGDILYAVNDVYAVSTAPGTPIMATIMEGKYRGGKALGKFTSSPNGLIINFSTISHNGQVYPFHGYAVNIEEAKAGVASHINTHFFSRWAGLIAGSFLEGFGEAVSETGETVTNSSAVSSTERIIKDYSLEDQAWIAAGKVGEKVADIAEKNFDRPPTVTLNQGQEFGILILSN